MTDMLPSYSIFIHLSLLLYNTKSTSFILYLKRKGKSPLQVFLLPGVPTHTMYAPAYADLEANWLHTTVHNQALALPSTNHILLSS